MEHDSEGDFLSDYSNGNDESFSETPSSKLTLTLSPKKTDLKTINTPNKSGNDEFPLACTQLSRLQNEASTLDLDI